MMKINARKITGKINENLKVKKGGVNLISHSIKNQLVAIILILSIVPILAVGVLNYYTSSKDIKDIQPTTCSITFRSGGQFYIKYI